MKSPKPNFLRSKSLPKSFYLRDPAIVARELLGKGLLIKNKAGTFLTEISEVEAYLHETDEASHSYRGLTKRNQAMFESGGTCYVYLCYGVHYCLNVVTEGKGKGSAVLIRAVRPLIAPEEMMQDRKALSGPGRLTRGLGIDLSLNGLNYWGENLKIVDLGKRYSKKDISTTPRIGISKSKDLKLRFLLKD